VASLADRRGSNTSTGIDVGDDDVAGVRSPGGNTSSFGAPSVTVSDA
jgi:hypothetical protein